MNSRLSIIAMLIVAAVIPESLVFASPTRSVSAVPSLAVFEDSASYTFYLNEEVLVQNHSEWKRDGSVGSAYTVATAGQTVAVSMQISVDALGLWTGISMTTPQGAVEVVREDTLVKVTALGQTQSIVLRPSTLLFENFTPMLMSQIVVAYDQAAGGKQVFPVFLIPQAVRDVSVERLQVVDRNIMGRFQSFTLYRLGLPGVDVTLWVDEKHRVCYGDVPAQRGAYVRNGYEALRIPPAADSLMSLPTYDFEVDSGIGVPMRDGIKLATDIYRPKGEGQFPIVLVRTPYKKELNELQAKFFARRGYVYAVQDCRGRFSSPGNWEPFFDEPKDGYDAIEWLAAQPWSNGKVGMIGASYVGWVQWWAARERPPHLVTIIPNVSPPDPYFNIPYEYGAFFLLGSIWWANILEEDATGDITGEAMRNINEKKYAKLLMHLPVSDLDSVVLGKRNKYWRDWIAHPDNDDYWQRASFLEHLKDVDMPVFHQSGWYDGDGIGSKLNYLAMSTAGHDNQKLILGPWGHSAQATRTGPNGVDFGPNAIVDLDLEYTRWLDHWLLGMDNGLDQEPLVSLFVMGTNQWLQDSVYPLSTTRFTKYYLSSSGSANTSQGNGVLSTDLSTGAPTDTFTYDPGDPTPDPLYYIDPEEFLDDSLVDSTKIRSSEESRAKIRANYATVNRTRNDILVYETPAFSEALTLAGPVSAVLFAASSAKDTDWFMRLSKVDSTGQVFPLVHGVIRARYRTSFEKPQLLEPDAVYEYHLDMWQTGVTIPAGEKLRVEVASASFPMFSRNLNTGGHNETETAFVSARQTIYHDKDRPSHVLLPVIPSPQFKASIDK